jgi:hypothetical protein
MVFRGKYNIKYGEKTSQKFYVCKNIKPYYYILFPSVIFFYILNTGCRRASKEEKSGN